MPGNRLFQHVLCASNRAAVASMLRPVGITLPRKGKHASVLVTLHMHEERPSVLFTVRSSRLTRHRNQVSFPGGLTDEGDRDAVHTALRETEEELGIPASQVDVWGLLPSMPDRLGLVTITPVIGNLGELNPNNLRINTEEVHSVFSLSLEHLANPANHRHTQFKPYNVYFPVFLGGSRRVWGITGFILDVTLKHILPPEINYQPIAMMIESQRLVPLDKVYAEE